MVFIGPLGSELANNDGDEDPMATSSVTVVDLPITYTTKQDEIMANKSIEGYITDRKKYEILYRCYGLVVRQVMKGGSCCRLPFSYKLPSPSAVVSAIVADTKYSKFLDELEKPRQTASEVKPVQNRHTGAPPSADNV